MPVVPPSDLEAIQFCESHLPIWSAAPTTLGLTASQCTNLTTQTKAARDAYTAAQNARLAAKAATTTFHTNIATMRSTVGDMVKLVKAFADASANPGAIYAAAQIPEPAAPTPPAPPSMPTSVTVGLNPDGSITLRWKATDSSPSSGCTFNISRRLGTTGMYQICGSGTSKRGGNYEFTDLTLPYGTQAASYIIVGKRSNPPQTGTPSEAINVQFGVGGGGGMFVSSVTGADLKMAA
jgi:hypothetical protein